jgi:hypothetical protein
MMTASLALVTLFIGIFIGCFVGAAILLYLMQREQDKQITGKPDNAHGHGSWSELRDRFHE